ncbi:MAG: hypothetical protein U0401_21045, partial [Anaerolineae bacterium]
MIEYQHAIGMLEAEATLAPTETLAALTDESVAPPRDPLSLLERIARNASTARPKWSTLSSDPTSEALLTQLDSLDATSAHLTPMEALLIYAALENTAAAVEAERRHLATLLESKVVGSLTVLLSQAKMYEQTLGVNPATRTAISVLTSLVRQVLQQVHDLETNLYPTVLETLGLEPALEALVNQEMRDHRVQVILGLERMRERLPSQIELALFRVTQDTLYCAIHKAGATQVNICLKRQRERVTFKLADNGILVTGEDLLPATRQRIEQLGGTIETQISQPRGFEMIITFAVDTPIQLTQREMEVLQLLAQGLS